MRRLFGILVIATLAALWAAPAGADTAPYLDGTQYLDYVDVGDVVSESGHNLLTWGPIQPDTALPGNTTAYGGIYPGSCRPIWAGDPRYASLELDFGQTGAVMLSIRHLDGAAAEDDSFEGYVGAMSGDPLFGYVGIGGGENWYWLNTVVTGYTGLQTLYLAVPDTVDHWGSYDIYGQMCIDQVGLTSLATIDPVAPDADPINCSSVKTVGFHFMKGADEIRGYSAQVQCSAELSFDADDVHFNTLPVGATGQTFVTENVSGSDYTIDYTVMGGSVGIPDDVDLFSIDFHGAQDGVGTVGISYATLGALDGQPVSVIFAGTAAVNVDCTASDTPTLNGEPGFTAGAANTVSWSDESTSGAAAYYAECSDDGFATVFANSDWIAGLSHEFSGLADSTAYDYRVKSRDALLNESAWSGTETSTQDATPPETSIAPEPFWVDSFFDVTYQIDYENGSGTTSVELFYKKDDGAWTSWGLMGTLTIEFDASGLGEGVYYFYCIGTDGMGNVESTPGGDGYDTLTNVDATAPATHADAGAVQTTAAFDVAYVLDLEAGSGLKSVDLYYMKEGAPSYSLYGAFTLGSALNFDTGASPGLGTGDGTYFFYTTSLDSVDNVQSPPGGIGYDVEVLVDTVGPSVTSFAIDGGAEYSADLSVDLAQVVTDAAQMRFSNDGTWADGETGWVAYAASSPAWALDAGADGVRTVSAEFRDSSGIVTPASDTITLDTTPPNPVSDILASRGKDKVTVGWSNPDDGEVQLELWRAVWYHMEGEPAAAVSAYPEYDDWDDDAVPARPATRADALLSPDWESFATVANTDPAESIDDGGGSGLARGIYYYEIFAQDAAGNWSGPAAENDYAASYLLGDVASELGGGDGLIDLAYDIGAGLALCYGTNDGEDGYDNECDVGPTDDYSGDGIPLTDDSIGFEDLMIFALNFDNVLAKSLPATGTIFARLAWTPVAANSWALVLVEPCLDLQGMRLTADLPAGAVRSISAGKLAGEQSGPCFLQNIERNGLDAGLALLGRGARITGYGELLRVTLESGFDIADVEITARNSANEMVESSFTADGGIPRTPTEYALSANYPNPFNPATTIEFALPEPQRVRLDIYAVDGRHVATLKDQDMPVGSHSVTWTGRNDLGEGVSSGIYFYRIIAGSFTKTCKMTLLK